MVWVFFGKYSSDIIAVTSTLFIFSLYVYCLGNSVIVFTDTKVKNMTAAFSNVEEQIL